MIDQKNPDKLRVENLYKIFGGDPAPAFEMLECGESKDDILARTGLTVGVQDTSFAVREGEIFVVMGLSGSGKSTLVRMLNRLVEPTSGSIAVDGESITDCAMDKVRDIRLRKMAMVFQHFALFPHMTVAENVAYGLKIQGVDTVERRDKARRALEQVGLAAWADSPPDALSGGMQQRVGLARGLAVDPEILLMDEPFSALDPLIRRDMQGELIDLQRHVHKTIVFITHDLNEALILGDRIAIMKEGRFVQVGTPQDIVSDPADDYVAAFTSDIDRGRVFTTEFVMEKPEAAKVDDPVSTVRRRLLELDRDGLYVLDGERIAGVVSWRDLDAGKVADDTPIGSLARSDYSRVPPDRFIFQLYDECAAGLPIAVVDDAGAFRGVVDPLRVFARLTPDDDDGAGPAPAQAPREGRAS